jgi:hypothetical protein
MTAPGPFARPEGQDRRQAWWGVKYVSALSAQAGFLFIETPGEGDIHSLDGQVIIRPGLGVPVQIKCTNQPIKRQRSWSINSAWRKNWEQLDVPGYFIQVSVPPTTTDWVDHPDEPGWSTLLRCAAFWTRIDPLPESQKSIVIRTAQRLTVDTFGTWASDLESVVTGKFSGGDAA